MPAACVVLGLFAAIGVIGTRVAWRAQTTFESLLAAGITAWLVSQAVINIGAVAGVLPVTGVPLPFVSYGGTSLIIVLFAAGLLANVARRAGAPTSPVSAGGPGGQLVSRRFMTGTPAPTWAVIAGGGTGGHLYPGVAVARALMELGHPPATLRFVGPGAAWRRRRGRSKASRSPSYRAGACRGACPPAAWWPMPGRWLAFLAAVAMAVRQLRPLAPGRRRLLGGYASLALRRGGELWRVPVIVVNVDAVPGAVNRWASRVAVACAVGSPDVALRRAVVTGVPVRADMARAHRSPAERREARGASRAPRGGPGGGRVGRLARLPAHQPGHPRAGPAVVRAPGRRHPPRRGPARLGGAPLGRPAVAALWSTSGCRTKRTWPRCTRPPTSPSSGPGPTPWPNWPWPACPRSWCPLPGSPGDHQGANARAMAGAGGAVVVADDDLDGARLAQELDALFARPSRLAAMGRGGRVPWPVLTPPGPWPAWSKHSARRRPAKTGEGGRRGQRAGGRGPARRAAGKRAPVPPEPGPALPGPGRRARDVSTSSGSAAPGMNAIATVLRAMGHEVSGSDLQASPVLERLEAPGRAHLRGPRPAHVGAADIVAFSTAVKPDNVELVEARRRGVACISRAGILGAICRTRRTLAVSGTHGKTTTTAMLAPDPGASGPGPRLHGGGRGARGRGRRRPGARGRGWWSRRTSPTAPSCAWGRRAPWSPTWRPTTSTTTGPRRPWPTPSGPFVEQAPGPRVVCLDDPGAAALAAAVPGVTTYGTSAGAAYRIDRAELSAGGRTSFDVSARGRPLGPSRSPSRACTTCATPWPPWPPRPRSV